MAKLDLDETVRVIPEEASTQVAPPAEEDILDWDVHLPIAPTRPSGVIRVTLKFVGRDQPEPVEDPWAA